MFTVTPYGAVRAVTGSMHLVRFDGAELLLDCGLFQGRRDEADRINRRLPFDARGIDAVVLSHAHLDHCGALPVLARGGFAGPIYCTDETRELTQLVLRDSAKVQQQDAAFLRRHPRPGRPDRAPLYSDEDVDRVMRQMVALSYGAAQPIGAFRVTLLDAGHILGSAVTVVEAGERSCSPATSAGPAHRSSEIQTRHRPQTYCSWNPRTATAGTRRSSWANGAWARPSARRRRGGARS